MVRRLANRSRGDDYASRRDYQVVHDAQGLRVVPRTTPVRLVLRTDVDPSGAAFIAAGGFLAPDADVTIEIALDSGRGASRQVLLAAQRWNRVGIVTSADHAASLTLSLRWDEPVSIDLWGLAAGALALPAAAAGATLADLTQDHLAPETFYFPHEGPISLEMDEDASSEVAFGDGRKLALKKCSYCARLLPIDAASPGALSFHRHAAKRTGHQNECRACKKWRINDDLNPIRTTDQLHESSLITRERKAFLREPEILQRIKQRTGDGLKSIIWKRFDKKCFYCGRVLTLDEVQLDHTRPLAYLWPIDEHATCLCAEHNNFKKDKFPVDFYTAGQLERLAKICGLDRGELGRRALNEVELQRILTDISTFAMEWDPRHFAATARKVAELRPDINLYEHLRQVNPDLHAQLLVRLRDRPAAVDEDFLE
jgi:hypothetical protein